MNFKLIYRVKRTLDSETKEERVYKNYFIKAENGKLIHIKPVFDNDKILMRAFAEEDQKEYY